MSISKFYNLHGAALAKTLSEKLPNHRGQQIIITPDQHSANNLEKELLFFEPTLTIHHLPDWDTLAYDILSPHQSIISERIACLSKLLNNNNDVFFISIKTLMSVTCPPSYFNQFHISFKTGDELNPEQFKEQCIKAGYVNVNKVMEPGECAFRGSIIDVFPSGITKPVRIDLFDNEIDTIKTFDVETQRSLDAMNEINLLPAHELPLDEKAISLFRRQWREVFPGNASRCSIYNEVSEGIMPSGIEYYLPLFFEEPSSLFSYFAEDATLYLVNDIHQEANQYLKEIQLRYEQRSSDITRPILPVDKLFINVAHTFAQLKNYEHLELNQEKRAKYNLNIAPCNALQINKKDTQPLNPLLQYLSEKPHHNILIVAESEGRKEIFLELLQQVNITISIIESWQEFIQKGAPLALCKGPLIEGCEWEDDNRILLTERQFFGDVVIRQKQQRSFDPDVIIRSLAELKMGAPIVHIEHGVGRYKGLETITTNNQANDFIVIHYADDAKIYVPVTSLHLISRYTGGALEHAPLHRLGSDQWQKEKKKAEKKISDVAAELLDIYAQREAQRGIQFAKPNTDYLLFSNDFRFQETEDQQSAIDNVIQDMCHIRPMDRLVCGDVGFGKTEVAMRAAFLATQSYKQVCVLVPTTLLATQHYENFVERFAHFPISIELVSRFKTKKETDEVLAKLSQGKVDILVGTHKLFSKDIKFKDLGLLIVDEEHRFGVKQKEHIKAIKKNVDILTMTATPIPRTLNMAMANLRDISIIATPPAKRLAIKTFCHSKNKVIISDAITREISRGGQVFFLHNDVQTIEHMANELSEIVPAASIEIAHGQMREKQLERIMSEFYHHKFNVLLCTTIIENGIDVPTANTIIINRADKFGLAQLHQLRGRVGRGNQQAYAYLLTPSYEALSRDAKKRLDALMSLSDLGAGFTLATHDMEIRGAGELLGDEQSGHMHTLGFSLYMELLDRAVKAIKKGKIPELSQPIEQGPEINLSLSTIIPEDYIGDIHTRLIFYKQIASAETIEALKDLQVELIDRFGLLPDETKRLFKVTQLKIRAQSLGIKKIKLNGEWAQLSFNAHTSISPDIIIKLIQVHTARYKLKDASTIQVKINLQQDRAEEVEKILFELTHG